MLGILGVLLGVAEVVRKPVVVVEVEEVVEVGT